MKRWIALVILVGLFLPMIETSLSLGWINRSEYWSPDNTTMNTVVYNKSCSDCLCLAFLFNQSEQYRAFNCHRLNNSCVFFKNVSSWSQIRINSYSSFYFLSSSFLSPTTASPSTSSSTTTTTTSTSSGVARSNATTGRYWACCKASCSWPGKATVTNPARSCQADGVTAIDPNAVSSCDWGPSFMCFNQQPWNVSNSLSYGYVGAYISNQNESRWCCACYSLIFTSGPIQGKEMIVQATNTAYTTSSQFVLQIPGTGWMTTLNACANQFSGSYSWGHQYNGVSNRSGCANLPSALQSGCYWRFDWFMNADYPSVQYREVTCPSILTANTDCVRY